MANILYMNMKQKMLGDDAAAHALPDFDTDNIRAALIDHGVDTPLPTTDQDYADIVAGEIAESGNLAGGAVTAGAVDFDDFTFSTVSGASVESINFFLETGTDSTQMLILFIDTATGLPITPNGGDINVVLNGSGLFTL